MKLNTLLREQGIDLRQVRLLRHTPGGAKTKVPLSALWQQDQKAFNDYQSYQSIADRSQLAGSTLWLSFVAIPPTDTLFVGAYTAKYSGPVASPMRHPLDGSIIQPGNDDLYELALSEQLSDLRGMLLIDWGKSYVKWIQNAATQDKTIVELRRTAKEPPFPGLLQFVMPLSQVAIAPTAWVEALKSTRGIYLLTCPTTKEQYVGKASGAQGFWGRWVWYLNGGDGGNIGLKSREPSDYQVSVLETLGSSASEADFLACEALWKDKLQSREMGLNRN